jgi:hypothetical protein
MSRKSLAHYWRRGSSYEAISALGAGSAALASSLLRPPTDPQLHSPIPNPCVSQMLEHAFKAETVGLVTRDQFMEKRLTLADRIEDEARRKRAAAEEDEWREKEALRLKKAKSERKHKLSFDDEEEEEEEEEASVAPAAPKETAAPVAAEAAGNSGGEGEEGEERGGAQGGGGGEKRRFATLGKDPTVRADFLPDKDRDRMENEMREALKREWALRQVCSNGCASHAKTDRVIPGCVCGGGQPCQSIASGRKCIVCLSTHPR